jgi:TonB-dependent receptor
MKLGRIVVAGAAFYGLFAVSNPALATLSYAQATKYSLNISEPNLGAALSALSERTGVVVLYPYELTRVFSIRSVIGTHTVAEALDILLDGTGLSGRVTPQGVVIIAPAAAKPLLVSAHVEDLDPIETITVTGYRGSLAVGAAVKRANTNFSDLIFAEETGKFPDLNIAESINRVPGIQLTRDSSGEGVQVSIRGLGPSFTKVVLNGVPIAVASDGPFGVGTANREVDLDMFPTELFTKIAVHKTPTAGMVEGGISGIVDMRNIRPFDRSEDGFHLSYSALEQYSDSSGGLSPRGTLIANYNWGGKIGALLGVSAHHYAYRADGYGAVNEALAGVVDQVPAGSCPDCNTIGTGKNFHWATVVPPGVAPNLALGIGAVGSPYRYSGDINTAGGTSGLSTTDLSNAIIGYMPTETSTWGKKDRLSSLIALQYRPTEDLLIGLDVLYEYSHRTFGSAGMSWYLRNTCNTAGTADNCMIPVNVVTDSMHYITSGRFLNSSFFLVQYISHENLDFLDFHPSADWTVTDWLKIRGGVDYNDSHLNRRMWSYLIQTTPGSGIYVDYKMEPGADFPIIKTNIDLADPNAGWQWYQIRVQPEFRRTVNRGTDWNAKLGGDDANVQVGYSYHQTYRYISARDNSSNAQACVLGTSTPDNLCTMPDGTVLPAGSAPLVSNERLPQYLLTLPVNDFLHLTHQAVGYSDFITVDMKALDAATQIAKFVDTAPFAANGAIGANRSGTLAEETHGAFIEANYIAGVFGRDVHIDAGLRYFNTNQAITGPESVAGVTQFVTSRRSYDGLLPAFNVSSEVWDHLVLRIAGSRTMTRADPNSMLPGISFGGAQLSPINAGNPNLRPYYSLNLDVGAEYYMGGPGVIGVDFFRKDISNFTGIEQVIEKFSATGIPLSLLTPTQLADYNANGGPDEIVTVRRLINLPQKLHLTGFELSYVQPMDFALEGSGLTATYTRVMQSVDAGLTLSQAQGLATGIAPYTFNLGGYYEDDRISMRLTYNYIARFIDIATPASDGIMQPGYRSAYGQLDLSTSITVPWLDGTLLQGAQITFDALNLTNARQRRYIGNTNDPMSVTYSGTSYLVGFRGKL